MAEDLGISLRTMHSLLKEGVPYIQHKGLIWLDEDRVREWLNKFEKRRRTTKETKAA